MYNVFATYYDRLTGEIDYAARGRYFDALLRRYLPEGSSHILLDLGCGTGSLATVMSELGYDVIGVDQSEEMLCEAMGKGGGVQYIRQDFTALDLYGTIDAAVCALDGLNHLTDLVALTKTIERVSLFTEQGGVFLFDVNTPYKHREILGNQTFVYDLDEVYCVWQNVTDPQTLTTDITLDFFIPDGERYERETEQFSEHCWTHEQLCEILEQSGFELRSVYAADTEKPLNKTSQRAVYLAQKRTPTGTIA